MHHMATVPHRARRYGYRLKRRFREDPFSIIVLYAILFSLFFMAFAFRGLLFTMFVKPLGVVNPAPSNNEQSTTPPATTDATNTSASTTTPTNTTTTQTSSGTYTVKNGDTLSSIAADLKIDWHEIATLNNLQSPYSLSNGQVIKLP